MKQVSDYKLLTEAEHIRARPGMWIGSTQIQENLEWIFDTSTKKMVKKSIKYVPGLIKCFSEILDNAIDESRRHPDVCTKINISFNNGAILIEDNGSGIPVQIHPQSGLYVAETIFTNLRAGSNFADENDQQLIGTNGVGASCVLVLSKYFKIESSDGKKQFSQTFTNGITGRSEPKITSSSKRGTRVSFEMDYPFFKLDHLDEDHILKMKKKVIDAAACNSHVKFFIDDERVEIKDFDDYIQLYTDNFIYDSNNDWRVGI